MEGRSALAFIIAFGAGLILKPAASVLENLGIDDAVGAVTVHGTVGIYGMLMLGVFASGYPALLGDGAPTVSRIGQIVGSAVFVAIGLGTGYVSALILKLAGMLRVPEAAEIVGLDTVKVPAQAYPEGITASPPTAN